MAIIRGGASTPTRYYKKKKKKPPAAHAPAAPHRPAAPATPKGPSGPGRVKSIAPFIAIAKKSQAGKPLGIKDAQYMQRLAWTTKKPETKELAQAIDTARKWIEGLKKHGGVSVPNASGEKVNIGAGGLEYHAFHEKNLLQPTKKYQSVLDSFAQNGGNDILSRSRTPITDNLAAAIAPKPTPQASDLPVPPADGPVRDIALGQWQATGTLPGPQKMVDLLSAGLSMTDLDPTSTNLGVPGADAWMQFMQEAHKYPSKVPPPADDVIHVGGDAADLMFKQADFSKAPAPDAGNHPGFWSFGTGGIWNRAKQFVGANVEAGKTLANPDEYLGKKPEAVSPGARDLDWFMGLEPAQRKLVEKALAERGYTPAASGPLGTIDSVMPYVSVVNQFVYNANIAAAVFSKDPHEKGEASKILERTSVQGGGTELGQLAQHFGGVDDDGFLTAVYTASMMARPVGVSESGFALWYAKKWGTPNLPQAEQAGAQGVSKGGVMESVFDDLGAPAEVVWHWAASSTKLGDFVTKGMAYDAKAVGKAADWMWNAPETAPVVGPSIKAVHGGVSTSFTKVNEVVGMAFSEANRLMVAYRYNAFLKIDPSFKPGGKAQWTVTKDSTGKMVGTLDPTGKTFPDQDAVDHANGWSSLVEDAAKAWKMSSGRSIWYEYLSEAGVDPAKHEFTAFWGQMGIDTGLGFPLQAGAAKLVGAAAASPPAMAALKALRVQSHSEILTAATSPSLIKAAYNVTDEAARELSKIKNVDEMLLKLNGPDQFGAKYFDPDMHFTARSVAQNLRVKMMGDTKLAPAYRAFMSPLPEGVFDTVVDTDQQVLGALRYAGLDSKAAHNFADGLIDARLNAADFPEQAVRSYLTHPKTGFNALIEKHFKGQDASAKFIAANGASTKLDELNSFLRRFRGKGVGVEKRATRVGYSLRPGATVADRLQEGSLKLPTELTAPVLAKVQAARKVMDDIDKRLPGADAKTAASLTAKRASAETSSQIAIHELNIMDPQVVGVPTAATEAQFAKTFSPTVTPTELALFSGGKSMQEWAIIQKNLHLTDINSAFKRMWLSRMGTMLTIIGSDEMLRGMLNGVNPLGGVRGLKKLPGFEGTLSADATEASLRSPSTMVNIHGITDVKRATDWGEIGPDSADITTRNMGVHESLKTFNAETSMPVKDWLEAHDAAYIDLVADAERAKLSIPVKPPKVGDVVPGVGVDAQIADLEREASILIEGKPEARAPVNIDQPITDADLRGYIRAKGGISRDNAFWSKNVTVRENRAEFGYLDTPKGGMPIDELADLIGNDAPGFGIYDSGDLSGWLHKQGAERATTTTTEANARLSAIDAEIARLRAESPKAPAPTADFAATGEELHHGTHRAFDEFDAAAKNRYGKARANEGVYFTEKPDVAERFSQSGAYKEVDFDHWLESKQGENVTDLYPLKKYPNGIPVNAEELVAYRKSLDVAIGKGWKLEYTDGYTGGVVKVTSAQDIPHVDLIDGDVRLYSPKANPRVETRTVYGKTLDLIDGEPPADLLTVLKAEKVYIPEKKGQGIPDFKHEYSKVLVPWAREHGYGKILVRDAYESGFKSTIAVPEYIAKKGETAADVEARVAGLGAAPPRASVSLSSLDEPTVAPAPILSERDQIALHKTKAAAAADAQLGELMRSDPRYIGGIGADGRKLTGLLPTRNPNAFDPQLLAEGLDNTPWIKDIGDEYTRKIHAMMSHNVTESHLRTGVIGPDDLKSATVQNIYGPVQYAIGHNPATSALTYLPLKFSDTVLGTLGHMATHLKKQEFGNFFDERMATLRGIDMPRLEKLEVARKYAVVKTDELSYLSGRTLVEENMRNVVMFLPAYRQFLTWWAKRFATHPLSTHLLMKGISSIPAQRIPDTVPVLGGVGWNPTSMNFFAGLSGEGNQSWTPPVAPTISVPAMVGALTGNPEAGAFYKKLNGGFEPGGPQMRWLDSLIYGAVGATFYDVEKRLGIPDPGSEQIDTSRKKRIIAEMVRQAMQTDGKGINAGSAAAAVRQQELGKGAIQWLLPGTWSVKTAKFTAKQPDGTTVKIDMGRIATAQWQYLSAVTPEAKAKVLADYPEYAAVEKAWSLHGEKQLDYLSKNRWVIPLVSQRREPSADDASPITKPGDLLDPATIAGGMKTRYNQVDKYVLSQAYQAQKKLWDKGFAAKYKGLKGQAKSAADDPKMGFWDAYYKPLQAKFYEDHNVKGEMDRLLRVDNKPVGLKEHTTVLKQAGEKHLFNNPYLFPDMLGRTQETQLSQNDYEGMKRLEGSGLLWGKELVRGSRRYDQYLGMRKEEIAGIQRRFLTAALSPYKSSVHPDDWALFGKGWDEKRGNKLLGFLGEIDKRSAVLGKLKFATKEYKAEYYKLKDYINTVRTKNPVLAPYIGATAPKLLGTGQLALDKPIFVDVKPKTMAEWEKMRTTLYSTPGVVTATNVLKLKQKASPELRANWDEATRALSWDFTFRLAAQGRDALTKSNNPYGWYKGWTIESKYGQTMEKWMTQNMHAFTNSKAHISDSFYRQWGEADKAAGGNIIYDLLDTSK